MYPWIKILLFIALLVVLALFIYSILPNLVTRLFHLGVVRRAVPNSTVALTFDDGPDEKYTPRLLDALAKSRLKATFFVIGEKAMRHPAIIRRMIAEGHEVQVHGLTHAFVPLLSPFSSFRNFYSTRDWLLHEFDVLTSFYRPTWGLCNAAVLLGAWNKRYRLVTWSIMVGDWKKTSMEALLSKIERRLHPGAIIVLHDSDETFGAECGAPQSVVDLIPKLAISLKDRGYSCDILSNCVLQKREVR